MTAQNKLVAAVIVIAACAISPAGALADPIIPNANFSLGYSGFSSSYSYAAYPSNESPGLMYPEGMFTVGSNAGFVHDLWADVRDHTTGDGQMLIVNGNPAAGVPVWSTTVDVDPDTQYDFTAWAASIYPVSPSNLAFSINGILLDSPFLLPSQTGAWRQFAAGWYSGTTRNAILSLIDLNTTRYGNDFALDDIALTVRPRISLQTIEFDDPEEPPAPVPDPGSTLLLLSGGLAGLAGLQRRLKS